MWVCVERMCSRLKGYVCCEEVHNVKIHTRMCIARECILVNHRYLDIIMTVRAMTTLVPTAFASLTMSSFSEHRVSRGRVIIGALASPASRQMSFFDGDFNRTRASFRTGTRARFGIKTRARAEVRARCC